MKTIDGENYRDFHELKFAGVEVERLKSLVLSLESGVFAYIFYMGWLSEEEAMSGLPKKELMIPVKPPIETKTIQESFGLSFEKGKVKFNPRSVIKEEGPHVIKWRDYYFRDSDLIKHGLWPVDKQPESTLPEWLEPETLKESTRLWKAFQSRQNQYIKSEEAHRGKITKKDIGKPDLKVFITSVYAGQKSVIPESVIKKLALKYKRGLEGFICDIVRQLARLKGDDETAGLRDQLLYKKLKNKP